ncbi:MAG: MBL fold metallo-hydrolase, partial [Lachnospiraceae bacterium]|nr:MBL fold metallo-hydrolase [Lachnospiraceae bacterium]
EQTWNVALAIGKVLLKNGKVGYIDPYAGDDYKESADFILVTHQHGDHNQIDKVTQNDGCIIIQNFDALVDGVYKTFDVCDMHIEATEAYNKNHPKDQCVGYILTIDGKKVYVAGDTSTTEQMKELGSYNLDYAFLPMDGKYNMDIDEAIQCEKLIKAKHTIPYHIAPGALFDEDRAKKFKTDSTYILRPGEYLEIK